MRLGLCLDGTMAIVEAVHAARLADAAGLDSVWVSEQVGHRDAVSTAAAVLAATERIRVVPMALTPYTRHPVTIAAAVAALAEWAPGRVAVALGPGSPRGLASIGISLTHPARRLAETGAAVRRWLAGDQPEGMPPLRFRPPGSVRLYLTATRPRMLQVAAEFDGVVLTGGLSPGAVAWSRRQVGRDDIEVVSIVLYARPAGSRTADAVLREMLAALVASPHHQAVLRATEPELDLAPILAAHAAGDPGRACRLLPDALVRSHGLQEGEAMPARLGAYQAAGTDLAVLWPMGDAGDWRWLGTLT